MKFIKTNYKRLMKFLSYFKMDYTGLECTLCAYYHCVKGWQLLKRGNKVNPVHILCLSCCTYCLLCTCIHVSEIIHLEIFVVQCIFMNLQSPCGHYSNRSRERGKV